MTRSNLVAFKGGAPKVKPLQDRFGVNGLMVYGFEGTKHLKDVYRNAESCYLLTTSAKELEKQRNFNRKTAYSNFPDVGTDTRYDKECIATSVIPCSMLFLGGVFAKDFCQETEIGDSLVEIANYCYQNGAVGVYAKALPEETIGFVINLHEPSTRDGLNGYVNLMYDYTGKWDAFLSGWDNDGGPDRSRRTAIRAKAMKDEE